MPKSDQYRRFAQECLLLARDAEDERARASLLHMAQVWFRLAEECVSEVERKTIGYQLTLVVRLRSHPSPSLSHFFQNLPFAICLGLLSQAIAFLRKLAILR